MRSIDELKYTLNRLYDEAAHNYQTGKSATEKRIQNAEAAISERREQHESAQNSEANRARSIDSEIRREMQEKRSQLELRMRALDDECRAQAAGNSNEVKLLAAGNMLPLLSLGTLATESKNAAQFPAYIPFIGHNNLCIQGKIEQTWVHSLLLNTVASAYLAVPAGQLLVTVYDPKVSGALSVFHDIASKTSELFSKVGRESEDLNKTLDFHIARLGEVEGSMSGHFSSMSEMIQRTGQQEYPYRLLVVLQDSSEIDQRTESKLTKLMANGPKYGINVIWQRTETFPTKHSKDDSFGSSVSITSNRNNLTAEFKPDGKNWKKFAFNPYKAPSQARINQVNRTVSGAAEEGALPTIQLRDLFDHIASGSSAELGIKAVAGRAGQNIIDFTIGDELTNALIGGAAGRGKSNLLKIIVYTMAAAYSPDELEMFLLDFKQGVEFNQFVADSHKPGLPNARVVSTESDIAFGTSTLQHFVDEITRRNNLFKANGVDDYKMYRRVTGQKLPRWLLVVDEFQGLFKSESTEEVTELLDSLARQGRSAGLHFILASQSLSGIRMNSGKQDAIFGQTPLRIVLGLDQDQSALFLRNDNKAAAQLRYRGQAIINRHHGNPDENQVFVVAYAEKPELDSLQRHLSDKDQQLTGGHPRPVRIYRGDEPTHVASMDLSALPSRSEDGFPVVFGQEATVSASFAYQELQPIAGHHVLVLGTDFHAAIGMKQMMTLSAAVSQPGLNVLFLDAMIPSQRRIANFDLWRSTLESLGANVITTEDTDEVFSLVEERLSGQDTLVVALGAENQDFEPRNRADEDFIRTWPRKGVHFISHWTSRSAMPRSIRAEAFQFILFASASADDFAQAASVSYSSIPPASAAKISSFRRTGEFSGLTTVTPVVPLTEEEFGKWL